MTELEAIKILESKFDKSCGDYRYQNAEKLDYEDALYAAIAALKAQSDRKNGGWISVKDRLPPEHDSMFFKNFAGTSKWNPAMFKKSSDEVNVCGVYPDGKTFVTHSKTHDGKWDISSIFQMKITRWQPLPEPPKEDAE